MPFQTSRLAAAVLLVFPSAVLAQSDALTSSAPATPAPTKKAAKEKETAQMQRVEIKGAAADYDPRRDDTASKTVLNRDEIQKYGDTSVFDVLKRAPGVTVTGNVLRMRGLGAGYTQILVNGDRPPPGFSLDALTPDQIERIEIVRSASAEFSMQAIAGTINIILRKVVAKPQRDARLAYNHSSQNQGPTVSGTWANKVGQLSYFINGAAWKGTNSYSTGNDEQFWAPSGQMTQSRDSLNRGGGKWEGAVLFPRVLYKFDNGDELNVSGAFQKSRSEWAGVWSNRTLLGTFPQPDYVEGEGATPSDQRVLKGDINWMSKIAGGKLDLTMSVERSRFTSDSDNVMYTQGRALRLERDWDTTTQANRFSMRGKYTRTLFDDHSLATGFDASNQKNDEVRDRHEQMSPGPLTETFEYFAPQIERFAAYVQDEWSVTRSLSVYAGARWEGVQTESGGTEGTAISSRNHVLSPVAQALYKFPDKSGRQLRLALTRTYKAPTLDQLTARRYEAALNTRFSPDSSGNPNLQPELANGIDFGYEQFWQQGGMFAVNLTRRAIADYIRTRLDQDALGRWLFQPLNDGDALVRSLEAEIKMPLNVLIPSAAGIDVRASASRNWSEVSTVPGPNNRLDAQMPVSANVGIDYKKGDVGFGANLAYQKGGWVQVSEAQSQRQQSRRDLDAYALWKLDAHYQLRVSVANILGTNNSSERLYEDASGLSRQASLQPGVIRTGVNLEAKF
jgi:outer membrane receptor for ferrienterochelin and colicins